VNANRSEIADKG